MKKLRFQGILGKATIVTVLLLGLMVLGCDNGTTKEYEIWSNITSLDQLDGTWKATGSYTAPLRMYFEEEEDHTNFNDIVVTIIFEDTWTIDADEKTIDVSFIETYIFSGGDLATEWEDFDEFLEDLQNESIYFSRLLYFDTFVPDGYSFTLTEIVSESVEEEDFYDIKINQNGTKFNDDNDGEDLIYYKQ